MNEIIAVLNSALDLVARVREAFPVASLFVVLYGLSPAVTFAVVEAIKLARKEVGCPKISRGALWLLSCIIGATWAFRAGVVWFGEPFESAAFHAITVGLLTPLAILLYYRSLERRAPDVAADLAQLRRRATDRPPDPFDDTGELRADQLTRLPPDSTGNP